ncbi:MAG: hypothetical protein KDD84_16455 [Caldilineaceae bacterium]|nr:hypothetical protein [Caldilineaceae bacterium]
MNDFLSKHRLKELLQTNQRPCVSIYMPTHRKGDQTQQDPIRLRNLLDSAAQQLQDADLRRPLAAKILDPARRLAADPVYWQHQSDGLAALLNEDSAHIHRLPLQFEELVLVSDQFHVKPILPLFNSDGRFYILALSQNEVRLLEATKHHVDELALNDVPTSLADALWYDDRERQLQQHAGAEAGRQGGDQGVIFHGHGIGEDDHKNAILRFFQQVDRGVRAILNDESLPMVLAGVDYLQPIYHQASSYPHLMTRGVTGNPEQLSPEALHQQAWAIVQPSFQHECDKAMRRFQTASAHDLGSKRIREIVPAAHAGRVETVFTAVGEQCWGDFDPSTYEVSVTASPGNGQQDLLNDIAAQTLLGDGQVYALPRQEIPDHAQAAAIFRY